MQICRSARVTHLPNADALSITTVRDGSCCSAERNGVTPVENDARPTEGPIDPRAGDARPAGADHATFRRQVRVGAVVLLLVNVMVGLLARQQQHAIIDYALNVY